MANSEFANGIRCYRTPSPDFPDPVRILTP